MQQLVLIFFPYLNVIMFTSQPSPFDSDTSCSNTDARAWCNTRGFGNVVFEHTLNDHSRIQPTHRLETIHHPHQSCMYLNQKALTPAPSPALQGVMNASCHNDGNVPNWCIPAMDNLTTQAQMFKNVPYDTHCDCTRLTTPDTTRKSVDNDKE